jgi:hypothetical protein
MLREGGTWPRAETRPVRHLRFGRTACRRELAGSGAAMLSGVWKLAIVAVVALIAYGRLGLPRHPLFRLLLPWTSTPSRATGPPSKASNRPAWMSDRWFVFLMVLAATALAAWIVTRMTVMAPGVHSPAH